MNCFLRSLLLLVSGTLFCLAETSATGPTFQLIHKSGASTSYVLETNERAVIENNTSHSELLAKSAKHPSYKLLTLNEKKPSSTNIMKEETVKDANVFYKEGIKDEAHRYISTGEIIVTFNAEEKLDFKDFAAAHQLTYIKMIGPSELRTVLFTNHSDKNDIELSSTLVKLPSVKSAKPNWILPFKLF
ncbi:MAG: hypothetical protein PHO65_04095 [Sulfurovum sp.]|nr:hypothetical protein [Sulfurovum sp.]